MTEAPEQGFRCSVLSRANGESQEGTASTVRDFLLVECSGPWGVEAVRDCRLPDPVKLRLRRLERENGVRPLLIRRPVRPVAGPTRVFAAYAGPDGTSLQTTTVDHPSALTDLDLTASGPERCAGWEEVDGPLFAVCTHGRHDACCAERGRPLAAALAEVAPEATWEVSHIGGDRFAANVLVLPDGLYYGRVEPGDAESLVRTHREGRLDLEHLRGRTAHPFPVQAAEIHLRRHLGDDRATALRLLEHTRAGAVTTATFQVEGRAWTVRIATSRASAHQLTCRAAQRGMPPAHELVGISGPEEGTGPAPAPPR